MSCTAAKRALGCAAILAACMAPMRPQPSTAIRIIDIPPWFCSQFLLHLTAIVNIRCERRCFTHSVEGGGRMSSATIRLTMAPAVVRWLTQQLTEIEGVRVPLFAGVFGIFGHGNVTCFSEALEAAQDRLPTWRGQNEQSMALAAIGFAKAKRRRQIMIATSSIGPGALNMVTAAGTAHANRLPVLLISGDTFTNRLPDPVLQQVEHFGDPTVTVNDAFKAVTRYWDRITHPAQIISSLPQAVAVMLDPADCGPAFLALPQDTQELAFDYPKIFFEARGGGGAAEDGEKTHPHRRRRRALFAGRAGGRGLRGEARHPDRRDDRRQ